MNTSRSWPRRTSGSYGDVDRGSGAQLGGTGLHRINRELRSAEIGDWVRGDRQRSGICTRAIGALLGSVLGYEWDFDANRAKAGIGWDGA